MQKTLKYIYPEFAIPDCLSKSPYRRYLNKSDGTMDAYLYDSENKRFEFEQNINIHPLNKGLFNTFVFKKGKKKSQLSEEK